VGCYMEARATELQGCIELKNARILDKRGWFQKTFHEEIFRTMDLRTDWREEYFTCSRPGVLRGMHFQVPPSQHAKLVTCISGRVLDVVVDLRVDSTTFGCAAAVELSSDTPNALYIPEGMAHGFFAWEESILHYKVTSTYDPERDQGILWSSIGFTWPVSSPIISDRDGMLPALSAFTSPFRS
jgi:dTDP-4-dehydrorhamnose 3,5-epimerase